MADWLAGDLPRFDDGLSVRWLLTLLHFLWQGAVIGGVAVLIENWLLREAEARTRYAVYAAALISLPVCVAVTFCALDGPFTVSAMDAEQGASFAANSQLPAGRDANSSMLAKSGRTTEVAMNAAYARPEESHLPAATFEPAGTNAASPNDLAGTTIVEAVALAAPWITLVYVLGVSSFLLRLLAAIWGGFRLRRRPQPVVEGKLLRLISNQAESVGLSWVPMVAYCQRLAAPTVVGVFRPMVLLPASLAGEISCDDLAAILAHEFAHIRRYDLWLNLMQRVIESLLFFHPVVWYLSRRMSAEREICCDDLVVASGNQPMRYAGALLRIAESCAGLPKSKEAAGLAATGDEGPLLEKRIERLMNWRSDPCFELTRTGMLALVLSLAAVVIAPGAAHRWATAHMTAGPQPPAAEGSDGEPTPPPRDSRNSQSPQRLKPGLRTLFPDRGSVMAVAYDSQEKELVSVSRNHYVTISRWNAATGELQSEVKLASDRHGRRFHVGTLKLSGDCKRVIASTHDFVGIWDAVNGSLLKKLAIPKVGEAGWERDQAFYLACTPDLKFIAAAMGTLYDRTTIFYDAFAIVWNVETGEAKIFKRKLANYFQSLALSSDGKLLAAANVGNGVVWDAAGGEVLHEFSLREPFWKDSNPRVHPMIGGLTFSPDDKQLAIGATVGVKLVDAQSGKVLQRIRGGHRYYDARPNLVFSPDGGLLARMGTSSGKKYTIPIWSVRSGKMLFELPTNSIAAAFTNDRAEIAVGHSDRRQALAIWRLKGGPTQPAKRLPADPEADVDKIAVGTHYRGKKASEFAERWKPQWGKPQLGLQYGIALTKSEPQFANGRRVPLVAFLRNVSDQPVKFDLIPQFYWNAPRVRAVEGAGAENAGDALTIEKRALLGYSPHYRDTLNPGEVFGPLYLGFGLGEKPGDVKSFWFPYCRKPVAGRYAATHRITLRTGADNAGGDASKSDWTSGELDSGVVKFELTGNH